VRLGRLFIAVITLLVMTSGCASSDKEDAVAAGPTDAASATTAFVVPDKADRPATIEAVVVHPPVADPFTCSEHPLGQLDYLGDALGTDCTVIQLDAGVSRPYKGDGSKNEDWHGWNLPLLAPFDGAVESVRINEVTNKPGTMGKPPASAITFLRADGVRVVYAHVQAVDVKAGDHVKAGQLARIGNNGMSRNPHVHIGAWRDKTPLQIRFDLAAMGKVQGFD
jgi:hypothetical protein